MLASVFTVPRVDLETHSLWTAHIPNITDGNYQLKADVLDADGTVLDRIQENITVDTSAPEADIGISPSDANATGYLNDDGIFVVTAPTAGTAAMLNIMGMPKAADVRPGEGYLFYQMIGLNEDGTPYLGEPSTQRPNTWMPLTVDSTMLVSNIWDAVREAVTEGRLDAPSDPMSDPILQAALALPLSGVLGILNADLLQQFAGPFLKGLEPYIGFSSLSDSQAQLIIDALGATIDIVDHLVPVTFNPSDHVTMPIQGDQIPLLVGDYGIRAMGIDTLFNVGSYAAPTRLRIVEPVYDKATVTAATIADQYRVGEDGYEIGTIYANTTDAVKLTGTIDLTGHPVTSVLVQYEDATGTWTDIGEAAVMIDGTFEISWTVSDFDALLAAGATVNVQAIATNKLQLTDPDPMAFSINLDAGDYPPMVLALAVDEMSITSRNPDSEGPQGTVTINAYTLDLTGPPTVAVRFEATQADGTVVDLGPVNQSVVPENLADAVQAAVGLAAGGTDASVAPGDYLEWSLTVDTKTLLDDTITKESPGARDYTKDDNPYTIRAFAVSMDETEWPSDAMTMLSVDNVDDVGPLGPTNITTIANVGGMVEADTHRGLVDENDPSVVPQSVTLTIEPTAVRKTYTSVMLVSVPEINAALISDITETAEGSGVFMVTVDIGALGIEGNGTYKLHALVDDEPKNGQVGESPERTIHVKNYERPDPAVFKITKDLGIEKNADSEGPQGTFMFTGYTIEQNSPPITSIRLEAKRAGDTDWTIIGTGDASTSIDIEDAALPGVLDYLTGIAVDGTEVGNRSVVAIDATYHEWAVSVDTRALGLADSITNTSPGARDVSLDDNPYTVRAFAVDGSGKEWASDAIEMFSLDNVDDVAPLGPTNVSVTSVEATDNMVFEDAGDGSYTVGGLVDKYDDAVNSPVATFTVEPTAARKTYASVRFVPGVEGLVITDVTETAEGSGVFTVTVDVGTLADGETYLENGTYMFHALAFDEFGNVQDDISEISVTVENSYRPAPEVLALAVDPESVTQTNPDSGAPQGTITLHAYSHEVSSPPTTSVEFEVKRKNDPDTAWKSVGIPTDSTETTEVSDATFADFIGDLANTAVSAAEASDGSNATVVPISRTYQMWAIDVDTTALEDTIMKDSPAARDASKDDNRYMVRAVPIEDAPDFEDPGPSPDATAMFSVDNDDDVGPLGPTNIVEVATTAGPVEAEDGVYKVGRLVDEYDPTLEPLSLTFTIKPGDDVDPKTYAGGSAKLFQTAPHGTETEILNTAGGWDVTLPDVGELANGTYSFHAVSVDAFKNPQTDGHSPKITVQVENSRRPAPAVLAITVDALATNPDSGAPQGTITVNGYIPERTSAPTSSIRLEVKREAEADTEWKPVDVDPADIVSDLAVEADLADIRADIATAAAQDVADSRPIAPYNTYQKWSVPVDTTTLEDTITKDSPGARKVSEDNNPYVVRAIALTPDNVDDPEAESLEGVTAMFSVDNVDDVAPLGPTNVSVTSVDAIDSVLEAAEDGSSYTVGGLVDKYDEAVPSPVATFTLKPTADRKTYKSVRFVPGVEGLVITDVTETAEGSGVFTLTVDVGTLADMETYLENGTYMFHALAFDEFGNEQADDSETDGAKISVIVENSYRPAPEVLALAVDPESITQTNPDSGAPQGTITLHAYSHEISSPPTTAVRFEVKRPSDAEWIDVGTATESSATEISDATLTDVVGDLANVAVSATEAAEGAEGTVVPISRNQMWMIEVDTTTLEDTITAESPAARDASKDDNQYMVRAVAIAAADQSETLSADGVTAMFSVDNVDDVSPLGPTNIVAVADVAGMIEANEDGSYTVGGIVDDTVPTPIAIFTTEPTADPITYASVNLVQTAEDAPETTTEGEAGVLDITIDVGLLENGTYMFHALAVDEFGNVQTDESPMITVHVLNFRVSDVSDLAVIVVDGTDVPEPPAEPIPLRDSVTVSFMVANGSLAAEELSGAVNGDAVPSESAEDPENTFMLKVTVGALADGVYMPDAMVTKRNGSVAFPVATVNVDNTGPMVTIESPTEDETVDSLPTLRATYHDGAGSGVDGATGSLALARLQPPNEVEVIVDQAELEKDAASLVYTRSEPLAGGAYRVTVQVTDNLGNVGEGSAEFAVNGTAPVVAIHSPASGQTFEHGEPLISGEFSGAGTVEVTTFTINDVDATPEVDGNRFSYTPEEALTNDNYKVVVAVTDSDGNTAQTSVVFMVDIPEPPEPPKDTTPPVISSVAPTGILKDANLDKLGAAVISAVVTDEQSAISSVKYSINGGLNRSVSNLNITEGKIEAPVDFETHGPGLYTVRLIATSQGGTTEHTWTFTLVVDNVKPTITSITPSGTFRGGLPVISASASDDSGVGEMSIIVMDSDGEEVEGNTEDDGEDGVEGITRLDFNPEAPLEEGTYTIEVRATDMIGNSATAKGNFTIDFDTAAPVITVASPHQNARLKLKPGEKAPIVSIAYADAESGINVDSVTLVIEGAASKYSATPSGTKITLTPQQKSASQVMYPLSLDTAAKPETWAGEYVVRFEVADNADQEGNVSAKNKGAREANRTVHTFSFFLEAAEGPILAARPLNYPNPFKDTTRISFSLARQATVSIVIYDATMRPVRVLVDNRVFDAGNYTRKDNGSDAIGWDGTSSGGEDLARGIYFCEIIVADGFEPEYAILKLALTR